MAKSVLKISEKTQAVIDGYKAAAEPKNGKASTNAATFYAQAEATRGVTKEEFNASMAVVADAVAANSYMAGELGKEHAVDGAFEYSTTLGKAGKVTHKYQAEANVLDCPLTTPAADRTYKDVKHKVGSGTIKLSAKDNGEVKSVRAFFLEDA